jgi:hypothetical protein
MHRGTPEPRFGLQHAAYGHIRRRLARAVRTLVPSAALLLCSRISSPADTHYVSKTGSNTYPYDTWATAADTVARAVEAASEWDTILIAAGHYVTDTVRLKRGQVLRGTSMDSTFLDSLPLNPVYPIVAEDSCEVSDFAIVGIPLTAERVNGLGAEPAGRLISNSSIRITEDRGMTIRRVRFRNVTSALAASFTNRSGTNRTCLVDSCEVLDFEKAMSGYVARLDIRRSLFVWDRRANLAVILADFSELSVTNCRFYGYDPFATVGGAAAINTYQTDPIVVRNCLFHSTLGDPALQLNDQDGSNTLMSLGLVENNTFLGFLEQLRTDRPGFVFRNNISTLDRAGSMAASFYGGWAVGEYNLTWNNSPWDSGVVRGGDTIPNDRPGNHDNRDIYPMFVDTVACLLQAFSPAIDAGDPSILDPDGSRADIGYTGGPGGFTYAYQDLPPKTQVLGLEYVTDRAFGFEWSGNYEADFDRYKFERSPIPAAAGDSFQVIAVLPRADSAFVDSTIPAPGTWYYRVRAFDKQGNASNYSNELGVAVAGVGDAPTLPKLFVLYPNYPNPFNATTQISYALPEASAVTLTVFDVLGRKVANLVDGAQPAGEHSVVWDAADLGSGVYFLVLQTASGRRIQKALLLQ